MKTESLKELQEAVSILTYTATDLSNAKEDILRAVERIKAAICIETPAPKGTFNPYDYVADDKFRIALNGVYHSEGFRVATDSHILVAVKGTYEEEKEGKIIGKDGRTIIGKYPRWTAAIPEDFHEHELHAIDTAKVYELVKRMKAENKLVGRYGPKKDAIVKVGNIFFRAEKFAQFCRFLDYYGIKEINTFGERRPTKAVAPDGSISILMPLMLLGHKWDDDEALVLRLEFD